MASSGRHTKPDRVVWWLDYPKTSYRSIGGPDRRALEKPSVASPSRMTAKEALADVFGDGATVVS
jgi:hypothetical protein